MWSAKTLQCVQREHTSAGESATPSDSRPSWANDRVKTTVTLPRTHALHSHTHALHSHTHALHSHTHALHSHTHPSLTHTHPSLTHTHPSLTHPPFTHPHTPFTHTHTPFTHLKLGERHATVARGIKEGECSMASHSVPTDKRGLCIAREYRFDVFGSFQWVQTMIRLQQHNHHGRKRRPGDETRPACGV